MASSKKRGKITSWFDSKAFNWKTRRAFYRHLANQLSNRTILNESLRMFHERMIRRKRPSVAFVISDIIRRMENGQTLSDAMKKWVPADEIMILSSGERSGEIATACELIIETRERTSRVKTAMYTAVAAPVFYLMITFGMMWGIGRFVVPTLQTALPADRATGLVKFLYVSGDFANSLYALIPVLLMILIAVVVTLSLPRWTGPSRLFAEKYFPYSFYRDTQGYSWLMSFVALMQAGMSDVEILKKQMELASPWLRERLNYMRREMTNGLSIGDALRKAKFGGIAVNFPNPDMVEEIHSMSGYQDFSVRISGISKTWASELEENTKKKAKAFGGLVQTLMYLLMGILMIAINDLSTQLGSMGLH